MDKIARYRQPNFEVRKGPMPSPPMENPFRTGHQRWARGLIVILMSIGLILPVTVLAQTLDPSDPETVAQGQTLYQTHCASCHGANLEGEANWQTRKADGRMPAPPHDPSGHTWHHSDRILFTLTKEGPAALAGEGYQSDMPAYKDVLSDQEIIAVLSFIKNSWPAEIQARHDTINQNSP